MSAIGATIGAAVGYFWGPRVLAHYPPWVGGLLAGGGAALVWAVGTLIASLLESPGKVIGERDATIKSKDARIQELEALRESDVAKRPNLNAEFLEEHRAVRLKVYNSGGAAEKLDIKLDFEANGDLVLRGTQYLTGSGDSLPSNSDHTFLVAGVGSSSSTRILTWRVQLGGREHSIDFSDSIPPTSHRRVPVRISVISHPENQNGLIQWRLTFHAGGVDKEQITPPLPSPPSPISASPAHPR